MSDDSDSSFLGSELKRARVLAGLTGQALAEKLGFDRSVVAKAESGTRPPSSEVAEAYAHVFPHLNALVEDGLIERWAAHVKRNGTASPKYFGKWVDAEKIATALLYWAPDLIPGLLQTEAYARSILSKRPSDIPLDVRVADRMERQQILSGPGAPLVSVILSEFVLHRCVGSPEIMREQLTYLADCPYSNVLIQAIPASMGAHAGLEGAVSVAERDGAAAIVYLESITAGQTTGEAEIVAEVRHITGMLRSEALPRGTTRELILRIVEEKWSK